MTARTDQRSPWRRRAGRVGLVLASVALAILLAEIALRCFVGLPRRHYIWLPGIHIEFHPQPGLMPGVEGTSVFSINSEGLRGDEPGDGDEVTILCLGGSTTECLYLDDSEAWPHLLQAELDARDPGRRHRVLNGGRSALRMEHHVVQMERLLPEMPQIDDVILLAGINDMLRNIDPGRPPVSEERVLGESFLVLPAREPAPVSRILDLWRRVNEPRPEPPPAVVQDDVGAIYGIWRGYRRDAVEHGRLLPAVEDRDALRLRGLDDAARIARENDVRLVVLSQSVMWREGLPDELGALLWMGGTDRFQEGPGSRYYQQAALARMMDAMNADTAAQCDALGVPFLDVAADLADDTSVFYDDCHFNEHGAREMARVVAERWIAAFGGGD